ncbi:GtrA family protein [Xylanibacter muris]|uniref:GtrA family protein n=1 Tax=Xylanibacter muris TaxID=2736290 RepID=A0ABX2AM64_9BACT|nr:GtrA family protein [Xylanibacter muris]NPD91319.1 GtrA family protein [Xylanibacter muris]
MNIHDIKHNELVRFAITGTIATIVQYAIYYILVTVTGASIAWTIGYAISFIFNFIMTTYFTFKVRPNRKKAGGFALSHIINWFMQLATLNFFIWVGVPETSAPIPMYMICMPLNFLLVRFFVKKHG